MKTTHTPHASRTESIHRATSLRPRGLAPVALGVVTGILLASATVVSGAANDAASNWPQWRGPHANGLMPQANPPTTWSETENVKWKAKLPGKGTGTPIVWGSQIFIQTAIATGKKAEPAEEKKSAALYSPNVFGQAQSPAAPAAPASATPPEGERRRRPGGGGGGGRGEKPTEVLQFTLLSIDRATGKTQWQKVAREEVPHEGHHRDHGFASHSPVTDGQHIYSYFGSRGLHCYDMKGELKWQKNFGTQRTANSFGEGGSPALSGSTLVVNWDHEGEDFIAAFDKTTGKELWRNPRDEKTTWTTPLIIQHAGKAQVIVAASGRIRSYDLATGKQIWESGGLGSNVVPTPVSDFGMIYAMSGHREPALLAIKLDKTGDLTGTDSIVWRQTRSTPYVPSPLLYGDKLYYFSGNNATLSCFNAKTGESQFSERLEGPSGFYASPVGAGGRIYLAGRNGTSIVMKNSGQLEILATNKLDEKFDASPAIAGNELFLRGHEYLYCLAEK